MLCLLGVGREWFNRVIRDKARDQSHHLGGEPDDVIPSVHQSLALSEFHCVPSSPSSPSCIQPHTACVLCFEITPSHKRKLSDLNCHKPAHERQGLLTLTPMAVIIERCECMDSDGCESWNKRRQVYLSQLFCESGTVEGRRSGVWECVRELRRLSTLNMTVSR